LRRRGADRAAIAAAAGGVPAELRTMAGVPLFLDEGEAVPVWWGRDKTTWRALSAWRRWSDARRRWAADNGVDFVDTFYPEWRCHQ
jgi:hypothetical protein